MDTDDLEPVRPVLRPLDLQAMSIGDLKNYVSSLQQEIGRANEMIQKKENHINSAASLFSN